MLYLLHEAGYNAVAPFNVWAQAMLSAMNHPLNFWQGRFHHRAMTAGLEVIERLTRRYQKPDFGISHTVVDGETVAVSEAVALSKPFCNLLHFQRATSRRDPKVLLVAPLSGHHATLLRGTVEALLPEHDVYITDWANARNVPLAEGPFRFDDYVAYMQEFVRHLGRSVHLIAVCQPAVPVLAAVSLMAANSEPAPRSMTLIGGPIDTRRSPTQVNRTAIERSLAWFRKNLIHEVPPGYVGAGRKVCPGFLQLAGFVSLNPERHIASHLSLMQDLVQGDEDSAAAHRRFYDEYNAVMDMPAEYFLETVKTVFQEHALPRGTMVCLGQRVDPAAIRRTALLTIEGADDDICGQAQTEAAHELCRNIPPSKREHMLVESAGHYGIFSGSRFRQHVVPRIRSFIRKHDA